MEGSERRTRGGGGRAPRSNDWLGGARVLQRSTPHSFRPPHTAPHHHHPRCYCLLNLPFVVNAKWSPSSALPPAL